jgi:hypothetical protein
MYILDYHLQFDALLNEAVPSCSCLIPTGHSEISQPKPQCATKHHTMEYDISCSLINVGTMQELLYYLGEDLLSILGRHSDQVCKVSNLVFMELYSI